EIAPVHGGGDRAPWRGHTEHLQPALQLEVDRAGHVAVGVDVAGRPHVTGAAEAVGGGGGEGEFDGVVVARRGRGGGEGERDGGRRGSGQPPQECGVHDRLSVWA